MKKVFVLLISIIFCFNTANAKVGDNVDAKNSTTTTKEKIKTKNTKNKVSKQDKSEIIEEDIMPQKGYTGELPDISARFQTYKEVESEPVFEYTDGFNDPYAIKPSPRDNPAFVNIILKQDKTSQYINDLNEIISLLEILETTLEKEESLQVFSARAYNLKKNVEYFRNKYKDRPESAFASYHELMQLNTQVQALSNLRREGEVYSPYITASSNGNAFSKNNINLQSDYLLQNIRATLVILKEAK